MNTDYTLRKITLIRAIPLVITLLVVVAYSNSLKGVFLYDDYGFIVENPRLHKLWPVGDVISKPSRAVAEYSFALNHAIGGLNPAGYHVVNILIHLGAALLLFGIIRRTLQRPAMPETWREAAPWLAGLIAALWGVHPLQTQSVTYIVQRCESLMGLLALLTLYAVIRSAGSPRSSRWQVLAICACTIGMAVKEVMVIVPILVFLYDRVFLAGTFRQAWRARRGLYLGLGASLVLLIWLMKATQDLGILYATLTPLAYFRTQWVVIVHYLSLVLIPVNLCLDYGWPAANWREALVPGILLGSLGIVTIVLWFSRCALGYPLVWFFVTLAPASSFIPVSDAAFDHRMYLPLAGCISMVVLGVFALMDSTRRINPAVGPVTHTGSKILWIHIALLILALTVTTAVRNMDYYSEERMWRSVVAVRPENLRARNDLAVALSEAGNIDEAMAHYGKVIAKGRGMAAPDPAAMAHDGNSLLMNVFRAHANRGLLLQQQKRLADAEAEYRMALALVPWAESVRYKLEYVIRLRASSEPNPKTTTGGKLP